MPKRLRLYVLSLRYSSWSMRPWLALTAAGAAFETVTSVIDDLSPQGQGEGPGLVDLARNQLEERRSQGSVTGLFPVLDVDGVAIHESLAICEWAADTYPDAGLWPDDTLERGQARAICSEMATGFANVRTHMACNVFASVPSFAPDDATAIEIDRIFELWREALGRSGGPFLFGSNFGIADAFFFPVVTRFRTYHVHLPSRLEDYAQAVEASAAVAAWRVAAEGAPALPTYDAAIRALGGTVR